jgi:glycosyltransferase involved in cell wall biosynthesis
VHNGAPYIRDAIQSIHDQTLAPFETIIVDDGSTDETRALVLTIPQVTYIHQNKSGQASARNHGFEKSTGDFLAFLDADDIWLPNKLAQQVAELQNSPELDCVFGLAVEFRGSRPSRQQIDQGQTQEALLPGAMLIRRQRFETVGPYNTQWRVGEVVDWYARAVDAGLRMRCLRSVVLLRRLHQDNLGRRTVNPAQDYLSVLRHALKRRRLATDDSKQT